MLKDKNKREQKRIKRVRSKIHGSQDRPRLCVFRSNRQIYVQIINDDKGVTLAAASEKELDQGKKLTKSQKAKELGLVIAKKATDKKIKQVVFDRRGCKFHGRVKFLADGAKENGLIF